MIKPFSFKITSEHLLLCVFLSLLWGVTDSNTTSTQGTMMTTTVTSSTEARTTTTPLTTPIPTKPAPDNVKNVTVFGRNETSITLKWDKVNNRSTYILQYVNEDGFKNDTIRDVQEGSSVTHVVSSLTAGTKYVFTLFTVFEGVISTGYRFEAVTAPDNVKNVKVLGRNESSITLKWDKVNNSSTYILQYGNEDGFKNDTISDVQRGSSVTHVVSSLTAGTKYNFTLFTVFEGVNSAGYQFEAVTAPDNVKNVKVLGRNETSITLKWDKVNNSSTYILQYGNEGKKDTINEVQEGSSVTHVVSSLTAGTKYDFTLFTVFEGVNSTGYQFKAVTAPDNVKNVKVLGRNESSITLKWDKVNNSSTYILQYGNEDGFKNDTIRDVQEGSSVTHVVSSLTAGTKYNFTLFTVFEGVNSAGYQFKAVTAPDNVKNVKVLGRNETSITLTWDKVNNRSTYFLHYGNEDGFNENTIRDVQQRSSVTHVVSSLTAGTKYNFTLFTVFEGVNSTGYQFKAVTAPDNIKSVTVLGRNETSITLKWDKVNDRSTYFLQYGNEGKKDTINEVQQGLSVTHVVSSLTAGTKYDFTLFTAFEGVNSTGYQFKAVTAPRNTETITTVGQNETSITLDWKKVDDILKYILVFSRGNINVTASAGDETVTCTISGLTSGTKYDFSLFALFENVRSSGVNYTEVTVPSMVASVNVTERSVTSITLAWNVDVDKDWSYFLQMNGEILIDRDRSKNVVSHSFKSLQPGTEYPFSVITSFSGHNSTAYKDFTVTAINCTNVTWHVTNSSIQGMIKGLFSNATATNKSQTHVSRGGSNVSFTGLYPGETYEVSLVYERNPKRFQQCSQKLTIIPPDLSAHCEYWAAGYSIFIVWNKPDGVWTAVEVNVTGEIYKKDKIGEQHLKIPGFLPAKTYKVSLASLSGDVRSLEPFVFSCSTDPRGVIAGSVCAVLLFGLLVCLAVFILLKRPDIIRKKSFIGGSKLPDKKCKAISVENFPHHFYQLSLDENRGMSQEYENLIPVGREQARKESILPENTPRNRFTNVLPYDWCRVKLTTSDPNVTSDYINASYLPGYNSNREYIATQGPLPSTVNDFWRMIWEQRVKGIVMVTNCTEGGRTKCERYWPADSKPCLYGELLVTIRSEQQEPNWTLREFRMKHRNTSVERTVQHFHFTAWPDHGVPQTTEVLIQFRALVRQHIEREGAGAPTVVHCSAGVGRTGTIIALDVLLQQVEKDRAVGINAFVHKMRLSRPFMVQTESQYVFLHQCIMDFLQPNEKTEENIYENADMIYANATALQELR